MTAMPGTLNVIGVGPGDPELMTLKAAHAIAASKVIAYFAKRGEHGHARRTADGLIRAGTEELRLEYPFTTEIPVGDPRYRTGIHAFYSDCIARIGALLDSGTDIGLLCEGDPFFYGSCMALIDCLGRYRITVIPGISGMSGCWTAAGLFLTHGNEVLTVLPATLEEEVLATRLLGTDAVVIMKLGRNLSKVRAALQRSERLESAVYVERGTMPEQRIMPMVDFTEETAPYFALVLVPGGCDISPERRKVRESPHLTPTLSAHRGGEGE
jgi:precorrin-2/cobalt-factor-2 C20-methyltransferase